MTCHLRHHFVHALCPQCGAPIWIGPSAEDPSARAQIVSEGGNGRIHVCREMEAADALVAYVRPRPIELGPVQDKVDWLTQVGRTLERMEVRR